jgi:hypothetical protein
MKRMRPIIIALLLAAAFFYYTTHRPGALNPAHLFRGPEKLEILEAAQTAPALNAEEQTNTAVYKKALPAVVNITSTAERPGHRLHHRQGRPHPHQLPRGRRRAAGRSDAL